MLNPLPASDGSRLSGVGVGVLGLGIFILYTQALESDIAYQNRLNFSRVFV